MIIPVLKSLGVGIEPDSVDDFWVPLRADIGEEGIEGVDVFYFHLTTPKRLIYVLQHERTVFERGLITVEKYDYDLAKNLIEKVLLECKGETWEEVTNKIMKYCVSEYGD